MHVEQVLEKQEHLILHVVCQYKYVPNITSPLGNFSSEVLGVNVTRM